MRNNINRCSAIFILILILGVGHSWADEITVYVTGEIFIGTGEDAWDNATSTIKVDVRKGHPECFDCNGFNGLYNQDMTNTGYTYNGYPIYSYTLNQAGAQFRFKHYKSGAFKENYTTDWHSTTNQIYQGYYSDAHHWITYGRDVTFYATPEKMDGSKWKEGTHSLFANFKYGDGESEWKRQQMTKTAYTYNGDAIYTCTMLLPYNVIKNVQFLYNDGSDHDLYVYTPSPQLTANDVDGKILLGWNGSHNWVSYGRDVTIYTIPDYLFKDFKTPYDESIHYPAVCIQMGTGSTWNTVSMTKTSYTYATYPIYKATILIDQNKFWEYQIKYFKQSDNTQVDLYKFNQYEPKTEYAPSYIDDKLYHGWNGSSHDFFSYRYDVALDMQSGGGGSPSIIAIDGSAIPSATMPGRDGYAFGGYWTETNGGGTQYYNADGSSTRNWDSRTITTLYAHWTPKPYTVTLEGMEATPADPILINVTYNAALSSPVSRHTKEHYEFQGYWTDNNDAGATLVTQLIDDNYNWKKNISTYTSDDETPKWIYPNDLSLFAKWEEHPYTIALVVSPEGAGTIDKGATIEAYYAKASAYITAAASTGYSFREWDFSKTDGVNDVYSADGYTSTSNPICVLARHDGTLTAKFTANNYNVNLENLDADEKGTETVSVTYNSSVNLTENITIPEKAHYDFGGYWTSSNGGSTLTTQLIDENGNWKKSISGYTGASGDDPTWVYADNITLYAKWTEHEYTIALSVSPSGAGTTSPASSIVGKLVTESGDITATPAAGWKFKEWQFSKTDENNDVWCADGYSSTDATIHIKAQHNGTLTAVFEERYSLVGSLQDDFGEGGMPGWVDYTKTFTVNSSSPVDLTRTCTLQANKTYKVQVHDNATSTNLGRSGCDPVCVLEENASLLMENSNNDVFLYTSGAGEYIFKITAVDGSGHPTLTVLRPYQVNIGRKRVDIDGNDHDDNTGGTAAATAGGDALTSGNYVTYNTSVTHTATPAGGYTFAGWWSSDAFEGDAFSNTNPMTYAVTSGDNAYAKFVETSTSVTLANDGNGKVQIGGVDKTSTTCGVTTTRKLTAVPNEGYKFSSWSKSGDDITLSSSSTNPTTLSGNGSGATSGQTVTANFEERWVLKAESVGWGSETFTISNITDISGKAVGYVDIELAANANYQFTMKDLQTNAIYKNDDVAVQYMTYTNHTDWGFATNMTYNCGITTAGKGTYRFSWNITDKTMTVTYPTSYQVNYGASVGGSVTSVEDGDGNAVPNGGYVRKGGSVTYEAIASDGYTFTGWCPNDSYGDTFTDINPWENSNVTATSNAYAKFHSTNFVIYRTGDKSSDPRAAYDDVESYAGGTISEAIEFRMKVNKLDFWYTLCLPFEVNAVQVWEDGTYYEIVPYWRTGSTYYTGHYILRRPDTTTDFAIKGFEGKDRWIDPESSNVLPSKNIPYIIQWHDSYFLGKYISFFGTARQTIPTSMNQGANTSSDETVNIYGNNSMTTGTVRDAYMLDPDYGSGGAWLRAEVGTNRTVLPFECFIRANATTTAKYRVLRRDMADTPTGWDTVSETENKTTKVLIDNNIYIIRGDRMYTIQGTLVKEGK